MSKPKKPTKYVSVKQARDTLSALIKESASTPIVLVSHLKPVAILRGVEGLTLAEAAKLAEKDS